jgi:hypothetical protein
MMTALATDVAAVASSDRQDGTRRRPDDAFGHAAEHEVCNCGPAVGAHDDQVSETARRDVDDLDNTSEAPNGCATVFA